MNRRKRWQDVAQQVLLPSPAVVAASTPPNILTLLLVTAILFWAAVSAVPQQSSPLVQAQSALDQSKPEEAINLLSKHLREHPADDSAHLLLAAAYVMIARTDAAETQYQTILKHAPNNYIALAGLGELYESTGRLEKAEPFLARAVKYGQHEPQLRIEWAEILTRLHRFKDASMALTGVSPPSSSAQRVRFFRLKAAVSEGLRNPSAAATHMESALSVQPDNAGLQLATAVANLHAENWKRAANLAEQVFSRTHDADAGLVLLQSQLAVRADIRQTLQLLRAIALPPNREIAFRQQLAQTLISYGETVEAVADLNRAVELDPLNPDAIFNLALAQFKAGRTKEALVSAEKCKELKDSAEVEGLLGDIQEALGDNLAAVRSYQAALVLEPGEENHHIALALEFIRHRNFEPAKLVLQQAERSFPNSWRVQVGLGMVEYFVGTKEDASKILLHAMDLASDPESALRFLGEVELDETSAPDAPAVDRICSFARAHPGSARAQSYCGALMFRNDYASRDTSRVDEIVRRLKFAGESLTGDPTPHCELGKVYAWLEKWEPAQGEFETCTQLSPNSAQAHYRLSQVYHHTGQTERSREELRLYKAASQRLADENEQHETTLNTFIYTIQNK